MFLREDLYVFPLIRITTSLTACNVCNCHTVDFTVWWLMWWILFCFFSSIGLLRWKIPDENRIIFSITTKNIDDATRWRSRNQLRSPDIFWKTMAFAIRSFSVTLIVTLAVSTYSPVKHGWAYVYYDWA